MIFGLSNSRIHLCMSMSELECAWESASNTSECEPMNELECECVSKNVSEWEATECVWVNEWVSENASEWVSEWECEWVSENTSEWVSVMQVSVRRWTN